MENADKDLPQKGRMSQKVEDDAVAPDQLRKVLGTDPVKI